MISKIDNQEMALLILPELLLGMRSLQKLAGMHTCLFIILKPGFRFVNLHDVAGTVLCSVRILPLASIKFICLSMIWEFEV